MGTGKLAAVMRTMGRCPEAERSGRKYPALRSGIARVPQNFEDSCTHWNKVAGLLLSCCLAKITRFCQSRFSKRIRNSSLSFLIPVSRINMTIRAALDF